MPRRVRMREPDNDPPGPGDVARRQWLGKWKTWAVAQLSRDTPVPIRVQLRVDVERALTRYHPDDEEAEIHDVVSGVVEETNARRSTAAAGRLRETSKSLMITLAPVYLRAALAKFDQRLVATMLKTPEYSATALTARLQRNMERRLKGDERDADIQRLVDAWVARRLAEQPPASRSVVRTTLTAAGAAATAGLAAYQHPAVKPVVDQGLTKAREFIQKLRTPPPSPPPDGSMPS
ncbi:MAG: hypothetical protein HY614_09305 [Candidatus Rokubacteria bacterium]|nr:hypothetical protein [Candidatus Rokubacteria bacterium]